MNNISNLIKRTFKNKNAVKVDSKPMYDVILHIGAPKTGSSAIQNFLLESRSKLVEFGCLYPKHGKDINNVSGGHAELGLAIMNEEYDKAQALYESYLEEARSKKLTLLLSSESFYRHPEKLKQLLGDQKIKIISFFRDPLDAIFSNYNQGVKRHFQTNTIETYCKNILLHRNIPLNTDESLERWKELFGKEHVTVIKYDKQHFESVPIQEVFLENIGMEERALDHLKPDKIEIINRSYATPQLEFKRVINYVLDQNDHKHNNALDRYLQKTSDEDLYDHFPLASSLPKGIMSQLEEKFDSKINIDTSKVFSTQKRLQQILYIVDELKKSDFELYEYIQECIQKYLSSNTDIPYDIHMLSQWFDIHISPTDKSKKFFSDTQLEAMSKGKYQEADFLRDIASLLLEKGDLGYAEKLISIAHRKRPKGTGIMKIKEKIMRLKKQNLNI